VNGDFSAGITNWNSSLPTPIISATGGIGGSQCAQFTANTQRASQNITVIVGQQYDLSFWLRFQNTGMRIRVFVRDRVTNVTYLNVNITSNNIGLWVNYTYSFISTGTTSCLLRFRRNLGGGTTNVFLDDVSIIPFVVCYLGSSMVLSKDSVSETIEERAVSDITDSHKVFDLNTGCFVDVIRNIVSGPVKSLWVLPRDCFSHNNPHTDLYITGGHRINMYMINSVHDNVNDNDREVKVRDLPQAVRVKIKPSAVYSIVCEKHSTLLINGLPVVAFGKDEVIDIQ
jgi:hypothetical protein